MADNDKSRLEGNEGGISRRTFFAGVGGVGVGAFLGSLVIEGLVAPAQVHATPASEGYLLVDTKKCAGCETCMLSCSLVHSGTANPSLSRIQITKNPFGSFPYDMEQVQCRQCPAPACVEACPTGAMHVDAAHGNVRMVDEAKCVGCERCVYACPFTPSRVQWNHIEHHAQKCDLCANAPHWNEKGGPGGKQACIESCPLNAITYSDQIPVQQERGYMVNLRNSHWAWLSLDTTDFGHEAEFKPPTSPAPAKASE
jgi:protein NrfC